jgi:hypothetical protein
LVGCKPRLLGGGTDDSPEWRQMVNCQEIRHTFGLEHQDEDFYNANLNTCMDYTTDPRSNQHPRRARLRATRSDLEPRRRRRRWRWWQLPAQKPALLGRRYRERATALAGQPR